MSLMGMLHQLHPGTANSMSKINPVVITSAHSIERVNQLLFSMNIGFAIAYALFAYDGSSRIAVHSSKRVRALLETLCETLRGIAPLGVHLRTKAVLLWNAIIRESTFLTTVLGTALLLYRMVRLLVRTPQPEESSPQSQV
jgi:hypothetical protein